MKRQYSLRGAGGAGGLWGGQGLQDVGLPLLTELFEHVLVVSRHLTGVALDPGERERQIERGREKWRERARERERERDGGGRKGEREREKEREREGDMKVNMMLYRFRDSGISINNKTQYAT